MTDEFPSFQPYALTPLDHIAPPLYALFYLSFRPEHPSQTLVTLKGGISHLVSKWPFLAGNVVQIQRGKKIGLEIHPPAASDLVDYPMLQVKHHQQPISHIPSLTVIDNELLHIPTKVPIAYPIPAVRFQANIMHDGIVLCLGWHHQVMDGVGVSTILGSLSRCCRGLEGKIPPPPTDLQNEGRARRQIIEAADSEDSSSHNHDGAYDSIDYEEAWDDSFEPIISRRYALCAERVAYLKDSCNALIRDLVIDHPMTCRNSDESNSEYPEENDRMSCDDAVTALTWLCCSRARLRAASRRSTGLPHTSSLSRLVEVRSLMQPHLPRSYLGNSLVVARSQCNWDDIPGSHDDPPPASGGNRVGEETIHALLKLALRSRAKCKSINDKHVRGLITEVKNCDNYEEFAEAPAEVDMSSLRRLGLYRLNWGPHLGPMVDFDAIDSRTDGLSMILPARPGKPGQTPWELRITLPLTVMEQFRRDELVNWATGAKKSEFKL
ncbi:O-acetyltransferase [Aspergillus heteromorphus CBS 117.55]|uniref:O-acetyltransferase n=1 Tax=Aspergillus heteromorphus CBS 117.55 TaxID=1448321 RepID=A0A317UUL4_9EURO|nr:O-acetyltransferase [Aspergillus heteromorphus CBS 117.55]PWY65295.1 O-acetyltransferase [Aspergillus heteromorphus CBS 117.55]